MKKIIQDFLPALLLITAIGFIGCSGSNIEGKFQKTKDDPELRLFELLDSSPALSSMFENVDVYTFNNKLDLLLSADPQSVLRLTDVMAKLCTEPLASGLEGDKPAMYVISNDLSTSLSSFSEYYNNPANRDYIDNTKELFDDFTKLDTTVVSNIITSLSSFITNVNETTTLLDNSSLSGSLDIDKFLPLIETLQDVAAELGQYNDNITTSLMVKVLAREYLKTLDDYSEAELEDMVDSLLTMLEPANIEKIENDLAAYLAPGSKADVALNYLINDAYTFLKGNKKILVKVHADVDGDGNDDFGKKLDMILYGKVLADKTAHKFSVKDAGGNLVMKQLAEDLRTDLDEWETLQDVEIYDFTQPMGSFAKEMLDVYVPKTFGTGADNTNGIAKDNFLKYAWGKGLAHTFGSANNGEFTYTPTSGSAYNFKGILYNSNPDKIFDLPQAADGYVTRMAKTVSTDAVDKPFRSMMWQQLDGINGTDRNFKNVNKSYSGESMIESIVTNGQLHLYDEYFCSDKYLPDGRHIKNQWAWTAEDANDFFGNPNFGMLPFAGGVVTCGRNALMLNRYGYDPSKYAPYTATAIPAPYTNNDTWKMPMITDLLYVMSTAYGLTAPDTAPGELSMRNCLKSMGANDLVDDDYISGLPFGMTMQAMGKTGIKRYDLNSNTWKDFSTQRYMPAMELLQSGNFHERTGNNAPGAIWGNFTSHQGDIIGIADASGKIITSNWALSEIALNCWEGYGPYTFRGMGPNGSTCKFESDWYSDYYYIDNDPDGASGNDHGIGLDYEISRNGNSQPAYDGNDVTSGRYHNFEKIYKPINTTIVAGSIWDSGYRDKNNKPVPKYSIIRISRNDGNYADVNYNGGGDLNIASPDFIYNTYKNETNYNNLPAAVKLRLTVSDCSTREEAIRKNFQWLFNQKRYQFVIPITASTTTVGTAIGVYSFTTINANGIAGVSKAKRHKASNNISDNAIWDKSGLSTSRTWKQKAGEIFWVPQYIDNTIVNLVKEGVDGSKKGTYRLAGSSYLDGDYCIAMEYGIYLNGLFSGIVSAVVSLTDTMWGALGDGGVLPAEVSDNFDALVTMANSVYTQTDIIGANSATGTSMSKFEPFFKAYYPDLLGCNIDGTNKTGYSHNWNGSGLGFLAVTDNTGKTTVIPNDKLPAVPPVNGISYPVAYNDDGTVKTWQIWGGDSKGKFDELVAVLGLLAGTLHEDGSIAMNGANIKNFNRDGYRSKIDDLVLTMAALNGQKKSAGTTPAYDGTFWINRLIDYNPVSNTVDPGSRKGLLPKVMHCQYTNINNMDPMKAGVEELVRNTVRNYFNQFALTAGPATGNLADYDVNDFSIPMNRLRFYTNDEALDLWETIFDYITEVAFVYDADDNRIVDPEVLDFIMETISTANDLMQLQAIESGKSFTPIDLSRDDAEKYIKFLAAVDYHKIFELVRQYDFNDWIKYYDFSFDKWLDVGSTDEEKEAFLKDLAKSIDDINQSGVQNFQISLKEGLIDGIYKVKTGQTIGVDPDVYYNADEIIYGRGKYIKDEDGNISYLDLDSQIGTIDYEIDGTGKATGNFITKAGATTVCDVVWPGLRYYIDFKHDTETEYDTKGMDYIDPWYKGADNGQSADNCPNLFIFSNYDLNMSNIMDAYNMFFLTMKPEYLQHDKPLKTYTFADVTSGYSKSYSYPDYKFRNDDDSLNANFSAIDWLYQFGSGFGHEDHSCSTSGAYTSRKDIFHFVKDTAFDKAYNYEVEVTNDDGSISDKTALQLFRELKGKLDDNLFKYKYEDANGVEHTENYRALAADDMADGHKHIINDVYDLISTVFNPDDTAHYSSGKLIESFNFFMNDLEVNSTQLNTMKDMMTSLFRNSDGSSTRILSNSTRYLPDFLNSFRGGYQDLIDLGNLAMQEDGLGSYMLDTMELNDQYSVTDVLNEMQGILGSAPFTRYDETSFWAQTGSLLDSVADMIYAKVGNDETITRKGRQFSRYYEAEESGAGIRIYEGFADMFTK